MMCCSDCNLLYFDGNRTVCKNCGVMKKVIYNIGIENTSHNCYYESFYNSSYSRKKRMSSMLDALFFPAASKPDSFILKRLLPQKFDTVQDLCQFIKKIPISDKRYLNLHFFCKLCLRSYITPYIPHNMLQIKRNIILWFEQVELTFLKLFKNKPFLNYGWLLGVLLDKFEIPQFKIYVKPLKCKKRIGFYQRIYREIEEYLLSSEIHV